MTRHERIPSAERSRIPPQLRKPFVQTMPLEALARAADALQVMSGEPLLKIEERPAAPFDPAYRRGMVYFVDCGPFTKVGHTLDIARRLDGMATHNPFPLILWARVPGGTALERDVHATFAPERHHREWFKLAPEDRDAIKVWVLKWRGELYA